MRRCDSLRTVTPASSSFAGRYHCRCACVRLSLRSDADLGPGAFGCGCPYAAVRVESQGVPSSWGTLACLCRVLRPRRDQSDQALRCSDAAPEVTRPKATRGFGNLRAQWHGLSTSCPRFVPSIAGRDARLASGCGPRSTGWDWLPTGFQRKVSVMHSLHRFPLSQALLGARPRRHRPTLILTCLPLTHRTPHPLSRPAKVIAQCFL
jgi:hypothetical protein